MVVTVSKISFNKILIHGKIIILCVLALHVILVDIEQVDALSIITIDIFSTQQIISNEHDTVSIVEEAVLFKNIFLSNIISYFCMTHNQWQTFHQIYEMICA